MDRDRLEGRALQPAVFHILLALAEEDRHGYAIIQTIAARTDGHIRIGAATLYRSLQRMLEDGLIRELDDRPAPEEDDERRRYYRITPAGRRAVRAEAQRMADLVRLARTSGLAPRRT
jgi:DNA-binding PadR family transcriptional regulator